jgi:DtxR family transcriptional regulator, Mn-dependent transcriptional regulator
MRVNLTQAIEDYLKTIYELTTGGERAATNQIAEKLGVTAASVTGMLKTLAETRPPLVDYQKHRGVVLSAQGEKVALEIVRHHRLLEMFLHQVLGYEWDEVHAEADRLEHVISEQFEERMAAALGDPAHDPHGEPIPSRDLEMPKTPTLPLFDLRPGQTAVVRRVASSNPELLRHLADLGIIPLAELTVGAFSPYDENMTLQIHGKDQPIVLGPKITRAVFVETK